MSNPLHQPKEKLVLSAEEIKKASKEVQRKRIVAQWPDAHLTLQQQADLGLMKAAELLEHGLTPMRDGVAVPVGELFGHRYWASTPCVKEALKGTRAEFLQGIEVHMDERVTGEAKLRYDKGQTLASATIGGLALRLRAAPLVYVASSALLELQGSQLKQPYWGGRFTKEEVIERCRSTFYVQAGAYACIGRMKKYLFRPDKQTIVPVTTREASQALKAMGMVSLIGVRPLVLSEFVGRIGVDKTQSVEVTMEASSGFPYLTTFKENAPLLVSDALNWMARISAAIGYPAKPYPHTGSKVERDAWFKRGCEALDEFRTELPIDWTVQGKCKTDPYPLKKLLGAELRFYNVINAAHSLIMRTCVQALEASSLSILENPEPDGSRNAQGVSFTSGGAHHLIEVLDKRLRTQMSQSGHEVVCEWCHCGDDTFFVVYIRGLGKKVPLGVHLIQVFDADCSAFDLTQSGVATHQIHRKMAFRLADVEPIGALVWFYYMRSRLTLISGKHVVMMHDGGPSGNPGQSKVNGAIMEICCARFAAEYRKRLYAYFGDNFALTPGVSKPPVSFNDLRKALEVHMNSVAAYAGRGLGLVVRVEKPCMFNLGDGVHYEVSRNGAPGLRESEVAFALVECVESRRGTGPHRSLYAEALTQTIAMLEHCDVKGDSPGVGEYSARELLDAGRALGSPDLVSPLNQVCPLTHTIAREYLRSHPGASPRELAFRNMVGINDHSSSGALPPLASGASTRRPPPIPDSPLIEMLTREHFLFLGYYLWVDVEVVPASEGVKASLKRSVLAYADPPRMWAQMPYPNQMWHSDRVDLSIRCALAACGVAIAAGLAPRQLAPSFAAMRAAARTLCDEVLEAVKEWTLEDLKSIHDFVFAGFPKSTVLAMLKGQVKADDPEFLHGLWHPNHKNAKNARAVEGGLTAEKRGLLKGSPPIPPLEWIPTPAPAPDASHLSWADDAESTASTAEICGEEYASLTVGHDPLPHAARPKPASVKRVMAATPANFGNWPEAPQKVQPAASKKPAVKQSASPRPPSRGAGEHAQGRVRQGRNRKSALNDLTQPE